MWACRAWPRLQALSASGWWALLCVGASSALGFVTWLWALARMAASRVTMFVAFTPLTALALGTLLLGEPIPWRLAPALLLVLAGLWVRAIVRAERAVASVDLPAPGGPVRPSTLRRPPLSSRVRRANAAAGTAGLEASGEGSGADGSRVAVTAPVSATLRKRSP